MSSNSDSKGRGLAEKNYLKKRTNLHSEDSLRVQPHSIEAEEGLLAACLIDGGQEVITICIQSHITSECFYKRQHQVIFVRVTGWFGQQLVCIILGRVAM